MTTTDLQRAAAAIREVETVALACHVGPDGDALGSLLGLHHLCRAAGKPSIALSNFDYAGLLTETILLGNVAMRVGKKIEWDGPGLQVTNSSEAAQYIKREYRKGWTL